MPTKMLKGFPEEQVCIEYTAGAAQKKFTYPGIIQCLSLTGVNEVGLLGTHISPGSSKADIEQLLNALRSGGGENFPHWYVVGQFQQHFKHSKVKWTSINKIVLALQKKLSKTAKFHVFDTSPIVDKEHWSWGIDIQVKRGATVLTPQVSYAKAGGSKTKAFTQITNGFEVK